MATLEKLKADYLAEVTRALPRLKELAKFLRQAETQLTGDDEKLQEEIDKFWAISGDRHTDYQLCQLASDLDSLDEIWESHPDNKEQIPAETAIAAQDSLAYESTSDPSQPRPMKTAKEFYIDFEMQNWQECDRLRLAAMLILDCIDQPTRIAICCEVIDRAFASGK